jgi:hypothetical protein
MITSVQRFNASKNAIFTEPIASKQTRWKLGSITKLLLAPNQHGTSETNHDGPGRAAVPGVDEVGDGLALHAAHALGDQLARVLGRDQKHYIPGPHLPSLHAQPVHRHHVTRQVQGRQHARAPHVGEAADVLVDDVDHA